MKKSVFAELEDYDEFEDLDKIEEFVNEVELENNLYKVIDNKLLHSFYLLGKYDVKIERAYKEGFRNALAISISVTALLLSIAVLLWKLSTVLTLN